MVSSTRNAVSEVESGQIQPMDWHERMTLLADSGELSDRDSQVLRSLLASGSREACSHCVSVTHFAAFVLHDGRYVNSFTTNPELVAKRLGFTAEPHVFDELRGQDSTQVLAKAGRELTDIYSHVRHFDLAGPIPMESGGGASNGAKVGTVVVVSILVLAIATCPVLAAATAVVKDTELEECEDHSLEAAQKL